MRMLRPTLGWLFAATLATPAAAVDHGPWDALLARHVRWNAQGTATAVDYAGFAAERARLDAYLDDLAAVSPDAFGRWPAPARMAFLINAYNAATVALVLTRYPELGSIKELGSLLRSPWKRRFVDLLGARRSLDDIEHELLRGAPDFAEPRIHFAVNCASLGCPALRPEAYVAERLEAQLADQTRRFLRDRNRLADGSLWLSPLFDWYAGDFRAHGGGLAAFLERHAEALELDADARRDLHRGRLRIRHLPYDWALNDRPITEALP